jgi:hypothetical protein
MTKSVYRHKMSTDLTDQIRGFAQIHRFSPYQDIKDAWATFLTNETVAKLVNDDLLVLQEQGYEGNHTRKLFVSMRYYYMKVTPEKKERKKYEKNTAPATNVDIDRIREFTANASVAVKPGLLWQAFIEKWPEYEGAKIVHKAFVNKLQYMKKLQKAA